MGAAAIARARWSTRDWSGVSARPRDGQANNRKHNSHPAQRNRVQLIPLNAGRRNPPVKLHGRTGARALASAPALKAPAIQKDSGLRWGPKRNCILLARTIRAEPGLKMLMKNNSHMTRRGFLKRSALAAGSAAAFNLVPSSVLGLNGAVSPSNQITIGFIGTGDHGIGWNLSFYLRLPAGRVIAVCDVDSNHLLKAKETVDDRYKNEDCFSTKDFREVLARKDVDAVMISTPDHWHTLISLLAIKAGKDVQCEKPTLTINEGKLLVQTVRKHKKVFQTSTEDRAVPEYHRIAELVRNGRIGKLQRIEVILPKQPDGPGDPTPQPVPPELDYQMWLGPAPDAPYTKDRVHFNFRWIWDYSGGIICDWGAHLFDTAQWGNDTEHSGPVEVEGTGTFWQGGLFNTVKDYDVTYRYANGVVMTCKPGNPSIKFIGTEGWVGNTGWRGPVQASSQK